MQHLSREGVQAGYIRPERFEKPPIAEMRISASMTTVRPSVSSLTLYVEDEEHQSAEM